MHLQEKEPQAQENLKDPGKELQVNLKLLQKQRQDLPAMLSQGAEHQEVARTRVNLSKHHRQTLARLHPAAAQPQANPKMHQKQLRAILQRVRAPVHRDNLKDHLLQPLRLEKDLLQKLNHKEVVSAQDNKGKAQEKQQVQAIYLKTHPKEMGPVRVRLQDLQDHLMAMHLVVMQDQLKEKV